MALAAGEKPEEPVVAMSAAGDVTVAWTDQSGPSAPTRMWTSERTPGGSWSAPVVLEQSGAVSDVLASGPTAAENGAGEAAAIWADQSTAQAHAASFREGSWSIVDPPGTDIGTVCEQAPRPRP